MRKYYLFVLENLINRNQKEFIYSLGSQPLIVLTLHNKYYVLDSKFNIRSGMRINHVKDPIIVHYSGGSPKVWLLKFILNMKSYYDLQKSPNNTMNYKNLKIERYTDDRLFRWYNATEKLYLKLLASKSKKMLDLLCKFKYVKSITTNSVSLATTKAQTKSPKLSTGVIVGIVICGIVLLLILPECKRR